MVPQDEQRLPPGAVDLEGVQAGWVSGRDPGMPRGSKENGSTEKVSLINSKFI
jgi:hypothetical protein